MQVVPIEPMLGSGVGSPTFSCMSKPSNSILFLNFRTSCIVCMDMVISSLFLIMSSANLYFHMFQNAVGSAGMQYSSMVQKTPLNCGPNLIVDAFSMTRFFSSSLSSDPI